jgi:hypothetical protein
MELPPFPDEGKAILAEWTATLESLLTGEQKREFDSMYGHDVFPLKLGQQHVRITLERVPQGMQVQEHVGDPKGGAVYVSLYFDRHGIPDGYRHLLR